MAVGDGTATIVATPHQLGNFGHNMAELIRAKTLELQQQLDQQEIGLRVLPGADVRIEDGMVEKLCDGDVLTLADRGRHVLLELPHELFFPMDDVLARLRRANMVGILSHPERNQGLLKQPRIVESLVNHGCLMQVTCGSLMGTFGPASQQMAEWMLRQGFVHFLATDAHSPKLAKTVDAAGLRADGAIGGRRDRHRSVLPESGSGGRWPGDPGFALQAQDAQLSFGLVQTRQSGLIPRMHQRDGMIPASAQLVSCCSLRWPGPPEFGRLAAVVRGSMAGRVPGRPVLGPCGLPAGSAPRAVAQLAAAASRSWSRCWGFSRLTNRSTCSCSTNAARTRRICGSIFLMRRRARRCSSRPAGPAWSSLIAARISRRTCGTNAPMPC
jgi:tyrosine-protein phosphatase YwqE